jgi:alpha-D-glucose phosphate-specific phosphoglucomutase
MATAIKFGTDGWRGIIADDFTGANVRLVAQATINYFKRTDTGTEPLVIVGYDNRSQSEYFALEVAKVAASNGLRAVLSQQSCSSPAVSYLVKKRGAKGGVMITASHNPPNFNGFKVKAYYGGSASPSIIEKVEDEVEALVASASNFPASSQFQDRVEIEDFRPDFLGHLASLVDLDRIRHAGLKVVIDPMYGSGSGYLTSILSAAGVTDLFEIRGERNSSFGGINPEPIVQNMAATFNAVHQFGADVALVTDGDADRVGAADSRGRFVDSHRIFAVLLKHLAEERKWSGDVVKTLSTTQLINKLSAKYGRKLYETPIGFKYICDLMLEHDILIGGEESGGIGVKNHIPERDGVLMSLLLLEAMAFRGKKLEELIREIMDEFGEHEYDRVDLHPDALKWDAITAHLKDFRPELFAGQMVKLVSKIDGTKIIFEDESWILLRPSGTEPVVRVYAEAPTAARVKELLDAGTTTVNGVGYFGANP